MTLNQLKYWELRWKQHYENEQIKIRWNELRLEASKLSETIRHNKKAEKQEDQRLIQEQIKINQTWADLNRKERSMAIDAALKYAGLVQENVRLSQKQVELTQEQEKIAKSWYEILSKEKLAVAEQVVTMWETKTSLDLKNQGMWMDALGPLAAAFGGKAVGLIAGTVSNVVNRSEFDDMYKMVQNMYPQYAEYFGPAAADKFYADAQKYQDSITANPTLRNSDNTYQTYTDWKSNKAISKGDQTFEDAKHYLNTVSGFSTTQTSDGNTETNRYYSDIPGVSSTPASASGGIHSSGVIGPKVSGPGAAWN